MKYQISALACLFAVGLFACGCETDILKSSSISPSDEDGGYTVLLQVASGEEHVSTANILKASVERKTGFKGIFLVHKANYSRVCWGRYVSVSAAQKNLKKAKSFRTPSGAAPFAGAIIVPVPGKNPGPPELDLASAHGKFSLLVAVFHDVPEKKYIGRKKFAVKYCKRLREHGYQAYYYHGVANSSVTIGTFPASAIKLTKVGSKTRTTYVDPRVIKLRKDFPHLAVNGYASARKVRNRRTGKTTMVKKKTCLIEIPRKKEKGGRYSPDNFGQPQFR